MINTVTTIMAINIINCRIFTKPLSFVFLKISRSWPERFEKPDELPEALSNNPRIIHIKHTNKIITMFPTYNRKSSTVCSLQKEDMLPICNYIVHTDRTYRVKTYSINKK